MPGKKSIIIREEFPFDMWSLEGDINDAIKYMESVRDQYISSEMGYTEIGLSIEYDDYDGLGTHFCLYTLRPETESEKNKRIKSAREARRKEKEKKREKRKKRA
jgi:hypothetical protein